MVLVTRSFKYKTLRGGFINIFVIIYSPSNEQTKESEESWRESEFIASVVTSHAWGTAKTHKPDGHPIKAHCPAQSSLKQECLW